MEKYASRKKLPPELGKELAEYPELEQTLLYHRGITTAAEAAEFLFPDYEAGLHDPYLLPDIDKAVERILHAVETNERILIYSDYDADGVPAAVVLHDFFSAINFKNFEVYIPHRHTEGFGLHLEAIDTFPEKGVKLIVTLDCGVADVAEVAHANKLGIDIIITDHHVPGKELPPALAVVDPKREDSKYPFSSLCGAGVGFKLIQAIIKKKDFCLKPGFEKWLLDMVGLATISDMVPLRGENRVLAHYGLKVLRKSRRPGLQKLLAKIGTDQRNLTEDDIGFMITPRINAASRMGIPYDAFLLLSTKDEAQAGALANELHRVNDERKGMVAAMVKELRKIISEREEHFASRKVIVLGNPKWRPALLGLAANTLVEEYARPVFLWGREEGKDIKGSCRSDGEIDLVKLMQEAQSAFKEFGGHSYSGGFSVLPEKIHDLEEILEKAYEKIKDGTPVPKELVQIDAELSLDDVVPKTYDIVERFSPFGLENEKPLFLFKKIRVESVRQFGKTNNHLELSFKNSSGRIVRAISFFSSAKDFSVPVKAGETISLIATMERSMFRSTVELRLRIVDIV